MSSEPAGPPLKRQLSWVSVLLLTLSALSPVVSVYGYGGGVVKLAGTGTPALFLFAMVPVLIWGAVYAELGSAYPFAGGDYVGVGRVLGPWAGAALMAMWLVVQGPNNAFTAVSMTSYLNELVPAIPVKLAPILVTVAAIGIALLALRASAWITGIFLFIELLAVLTLFLIGMLSPVHHTEILLARPMVVSGSGLLPAHWGDYLIGGTVAISAAIGGNQAIYFGDELHDPHRTMGRAVLWAALIGGLAIALPVASLFLGAHDLGKVLASDVPFTEAVRQGWGPAAARAIDGAVALAMFNALIVMVMGYGRQLFQMGRDRYFFAPVNRFLAHVDPRHGAPRRATLASGVISLVSLLLPYKILLILLGASTMIPLGLVSLAVWVGRLRGKTGQPGYWRSVAFPLVPLAGFVLTVILGLSAYADRDAGRPSILVLLAVSTIAAIWRHHWVKRQQGRV